MSTGKMGTRPRPTGLDNSREVWTRLIEERIKANTQPIAECQTQRFSTRFAQRLVQTRNHLPDFFQLSVTAEIGGADTPQLIQGIGRNSRMELLNDRL